MLFFDSGFIFVLNRGKKFEVVRFRNQGNGLECEALFGNAIAHGSTGIFVFLYALISSHLSILEGRCSKFTLAGIVDLGVGVCLAIFFFGIFLSRFYGAWMPNIPGMVFSACYDAALFNDSFHKAISRGIRVLNSRLGIGTDELPFAVHLVGSGTACNRCLKHGFNEFMASRTFRVMPEFKGFFGYLAALNTKEYGNGFGH